jgi:hypothetical protein
MRTTIWKMAVSPPLQWWILQANRWLADHGIHEMDRSGDRAFRLENSSRLSRLPHWRIIALGDGYLIDIFCLRLVVAAPPIMTYGLRRHLQSQCPYCSCAEQEGAGQVDKGTDYVREDRSRKAILRRIRNNNKQHYEVPG